MAKRGVRLVFGLLFLAIAVSVAGVAIMYVAVGKAPTVGRNSTLVVRLDDDLHEVPSEGVAQLFEGNRLTGLRAVLEHLRKAKADPRVGAVLIVPAGMQAPLWAKVQEVHDAILDFRKSGKQAIAYL